MPSVERALQVANALFATTIEQLSVAICRVIKLNQSTRRTPAALQILSDESAAADLAWHCGIDHTELKIEPDI